jgi:hypothetical protein
MELDLIPTRKFIIVNDLREVTDPVLFDRGSVPTVGGLLSTDIFGVSVQDRKDNWAFIRLNGHFLHPFIFKLLKRMNRNFDSLVSGSKQYKIESGKLIESEDGESGLEFLYDNWEKLNFEKNNSMMRNERIDVLRAFDKDTLFTEFWIVAPAFYRDVNLQSSSSGKVSHHEINDKYSKLIRQAAALRQSTNFDFEMNATRAKIQSILVEIYDLSKSKIEKKHGLIRRSLLGKSIDYGARAVISAPVFKANRPGDLQVDFRHCGVPVATCCSLFTPFIITWVKSFFQREIERLGNRFPVVNKKGETKYVTLKDPETYFTEDYIKKQIDRFIFSYSDRFEPITLPIEPDPDFPNGINMSFIGRFASSDKPETESPLHQRAATWCDLLYQAAVDVTSDKMVWVTRYPLLDYFGIFPSKVAVLSTHQTIPMFIGGKLYPNYPLVDLEMPKEKVSVFFIDTVTMSNLYLHGLGGDYDNH